MGIISDFKRLFWVKKAVAKSAAEKAAEKGREFGDDVADKASEMWTKTKEKAEDFGERLSTKRESTDNWDSKNDWVPRDTVNDMGSKTESTAHKMGDKLGEAAEKIGDAAEKTWDKAKEEGKELLDKAVKTSDKVWEKAEDVGEDIWSKAKDVAGKANEKFQEGVDSMLEKAKDLDKKIEAEKDKIDPNRDGWADTPVNEKLREHSSTLKGKDDFFEKADRYAEGDYSMGKPVVTKRPDEPTDEGMTPLPPLPEDLVDDAIIDDDGEPKK